MAGHRSAAHAAFGAQVRAVRVRRGLSQDALGSASGLHRSYVGGIEPGEPNPSLTNIARLADALDVPLGELFAPEGRYS